MFIIPRFVDSTVKMGAAQEQELTPLDERRQHRASTFPLSTPHTKLSSKMGRPYRTPSPSRQLHFELGKSYSKATALRRLNNAVPEHDFTPSGKADIERSMVMETPPGSPTLQFAAPMTPTGKQKSQGLFGLLTPSTPGYGDIWTRLSGDATNLKDDDNSDRTLSMGPGSEYEESPLGDELSLTDGHAIHGKPGPEMQQEIAHMTLLPTHLQRKRKTAIASDDSDDEELLQTQYQELQEQIKEAQLAASSASGDQVTSRRSTRLAKKETVKGRAHRISVARRH